MSVDRKGRRGLYVVLGGVACEVLGFVLLSRGSMTLAPALLIGSFGVMGLGIWLVRVWRRPPNLAPPVEGEPTAP